ncbi:hypothetical protein KFK09_007700 [Dendrobium nobile]|uniref:RING-type E3 ubiquitin transferase n=1 Tax=Dendrobium nobile TaxID=94219 RepID=A0A8T3BV23_DENNO|nr:hypothetical protein KFK09_007700 [Dendrobium nobile]
MHPAISPSSFHAPPIPAANTPSTFPFLPFFIFCFLLFCFFSIFVFLDLRYYLSALRNSVARGGDGGNAMALQSNKPGLDPAIIASFPMFRYAEVRRLIEGKYGGECAVCLSEFAAGDVIRLLTVCYHAFHPGCIDSWLISNRTCPLCRSNLEAAPDEATVRAMREVVASGDGGEDYHVIRFDGEGEGAAGEGMEIREHVSDERERGRAEL